MSAVRTFVKYWWNATIAQQIQRKITRENTNIHRGRGKDNDETVRDLMGEQVTARKKLGKMIKEAMEKVWKLLVRELENDI